MAQSRTNGANVLPVLPSMLPGMICSSSQLNIHTEKAPQFIDITAEVAEVVAQSQVEFGMVVVFSRHTTAAIKINENEPLLIEDMSERLAKLFPADDYYRHNDFEVRTVNMTDEERPNGHAHCQSLLLSTSETIPVVNGQLGLGRWQRIFLIEMDHARLREITVFSFGQPGLKK